MPDKELFDKGARELEAELGDSLSLSQEHNLIVRHFTQFAAALRERERIPPVIVRALSQYRSQCFDDSEFGIGIDAFLAGDLERLAKAEKIFAEFAEPDGDYRYLCSSCGTSAKPCKHYDVGAKVRESQPESGQ